MLWLLPWEEKNSLKHVHWVVYGLIALNVGIFLATWRGDAGQLIEHYGQYALTPGDARWYQFVTSSFLHAGWMHLLGNMMFLYLFGDNIEDVLGPLGFLTLYLVGGVLGDLFFVSSNATNMVPSIGASGCVAAVAGAYAVLFARQPCSVRVMLIVFPIYTINLRAIWLLLLWFGADIVQTLVTRAHMGHDGGTNFVVHAAGFFLGVVVALFARMHGVMRRYEAMPCGHGLFGYWPSDIEAAFRREQRMRMVRERTDMLRNELRRDRRQR